jgi:hypothetical protein
MIESGRRRDHNPQPVGSRQNLVGYAHMEPDNEGIKTLDPVRQALLGHNFFHQFAHALEDLARFRTIIFRFNI